MPASRPSSPRSAAREPKIADYPVHHAEPQLGVVRLGDDRIRPRRHPRPDRGRARGRRPRRPLPRPCRALRASCSIWSTAPQEDVVGAWRTIRGELEAYGHGLADKPELLGLNKIDALDRREVEKKRQELKRAAQRAGAGALGRDAAAACRTVLRRRPTPIKRARAAAGAPRARPQPTPQRGADGMELGVAASLRGRGARGSSSRSAPRCWSTTDGEHPPRLARRARRRRRALRARGAGGASSSPRAPSRSAARHLGLRRRARCGSRKSRPPPPPARSASPMPSRRRWRAHGLTVAQILLTLDDTEERRRHLNARATLETAARARRRAGHQRERHGRHRRDPLRRQRPPRRARRADGRAPTRWSCSPTSTASTPPTRAATPRRGHIPEVREITPEIEAMAGEAPRRLLAPAAW